MSGVPLHHGARLRWGIMLLGGIAAAALAIPWSGLSAGLLIGWAVFAIGNVAWILLAVWPMGAEATRIHATAEDPGRGIARTVATVGSVASLATVAVVAVQANRADGIEAYLLAGLAVLSVASSWALIQVDYMLRYASVYYREAPNGKPAGGIDFKQDEAPQYVDFAYFSVGLGMTYQVADTDVTRTDVRRIVIAQTLLAFVFGAGILATIINLITGLG